MDVLILGGTVFLGRHLVAAARDRGHRVTLFNRGRTHPRLFADVEELRGDRIRNLEALRGRRWDAAIDTCGYTPATVRRSARLLADAVGHYTFISSISVYAERPPEGIDETAALGTLSREDIEEAERIATTAKDTTATGFGALYGPLKALCEEEAEAAMPGRVLQLRPGLIVGPWDYSGRFTYWVRRIARGGDVLAPGDPERRIRVIDVRDLAGWLVRRIESGTTGVFNASGAGGATMGQLLETCRTETGGEARLIWVPDDFLAEHEVGPWMELPLWLPEDHQGLFEILNDRAIDAGLRFRPLAATVRDTHAWDRASSPPREWPGVGLTPERERDLLALYLQL